MALNFTKAFSFKTIDFYDKKEAEMDGIDHLEIKTSSTDVRIEPTEGDTLVAQLEGKISEKLEEEYELVLEKKGNILEVYIADRGRFKLQVGVTIKDLNLNVKVPKKLWKSITLETSSGDIDVLNMKAVNMELIASSGNVLAKELLISNRFSSRTNSGDADIVDVDSSNMEIRASSGTILLQRVSSEKTRMYTSSGDVIVKQGEGTITAETSSGEIDLEINRHLGDIDAHTSSGDIMIIFNESPQSLSLDFRSSSGEGTIKLKEMVFEEKTAHRIVGSIGDEKYLLRATTSSGDFTLI
jgi:lia operon protein LiaG